ncbi:hypothetical protein [Salipiger marinus]|jgi:hypothetical protein|uniref:Uncharacterized protein n=1 Tax=Salipiger marinus TaxID=555512 RepID=A0A1G8TID4_9RHOB|nr:hypothetical protein [Salipiger marinus]SDJ41356.1 hypothetical protein SAMN04487993_103031 [Salipiger marinus]
MTRKSRFLKSVIAASQNAKLTLPWARGTARAAMIARRKPVEAGTRRA